jgi:hypothetical protein
MLRFLVKRDTQTGRARRSSVKTWLIACVSLAALAAGVMLSGSGGANPPTPTGPPQFPAQFAPYASVLQANRGGNAPTSVTDLTDRGSGPAIQVTDAEGGYRAIFRPGDASAMRPGSLIQQDLTSDRATVWTVDPTNNQIIGSPQETRYTSKTITLGPGQPGSSSTPPSTPDPNAPGASSLGQSTHSAELAAYYAGVGTDVCSLFATDPYVQLYVYWWISGDTYLGCSYPTSIIMGTNIDQVGWDLHWHPVGQPTDDGGTGTTLDGSTIQSCLNFPVGGSWPFRTRGNALLEWEGEYGGIENTSYSINEVCQDSAIWTGTLAS